eukprot:5575788-Pyramimonas_sp.AAC.1
MTTFAGAPNLSLRQMGDRALVDTAAAQALVGEIDLDHIVDAFSRRGFKIIVKKGPVVGVTAGGVGGRVAPVGRAWAP